MANNQREAARAKHLESVPSLYRKIVRRVWDGKASPREAIRAHCLQCVGYQRLEVEACTSSLCPLRAYRPRYADAADSAERAT